MGITVVPVSMSDFRVIAFMEVSTMVYFEASWMSKRRISHSRKSILDALADFDGVSPILFHITVYGSDDAEDFVINKLSSKTMPAVAIFSRGFRIECIGNIDISGALYDPSFQWNLRRVVELRPTRQIESVANGALHSDASLTESSAMDSDELLEPSQRLNLDTIMSLVFNIRDMRRTTGNVYASSDEQVSKIESISIAEDMQQNYSETISEKSDMKTLTLFISGDKSSVGKSSICLAILASLVRLGADPSTMAYIKPITQCEADQPITDYCSSAGISHRGVGPVVFYKGFTRAYLKGETSSAEVLLKSAVDAVKEISFGKRIVIVDGVGYPSVGSICDLSNAHLAQALGAPVLLVGKSGVGDAVDSFNINTKFFESYGVTVLGCIFNKLPLEGFYNVQACKEAVSSYFTRQGSIYCPYGFIPLLTISKDIAVEVTPDGMDLGPVIPTSEIKILKADTITVAPTVKTAAPTADALVDAFLIHVDFGQLLCDVFKYHISLTGIVLKSESGFAPYLSHSDSPMKDSTLRHQPHNNVEYNRGSDRSSSLKNNQFPKERNHRKRDREKDTSPTRTVRPANVTVSKANLRVEPAPKSRQEIEAGAYNAGAVKSS